MGGFSWHKLNQKNEEVCREDESVTETTEDQAPAGDVDWSVYRKLESMELMVPDALYKGAMSALKICEKMIS